MLSRLGRFITPVNIRNSDEVLGIDDVVGISTQKYFINTKADLTNVSTRNYKIVDTREFAYVADTSRRGDKISLAFNNLDKKVLVSSISTVFKVIDENILLPEYLYIFFNRPEFDRIARFNSWGSARETFSWDDLCDLEIHVPSIEIQKKYVNVYLAVKKNQNIYEDGLDDFSITLEALIENLRKTSRKRIADLVEESNEKNNDLVSRIESGVNIKKQFFKTRSGASNIANQKLVRTNYFAFNSNTSRNSDTISIALNTDASRIVSNTYVVFNCNMDLIEPKYLFLWFKRKEFDRFARYNSWGSARETLSLDDIREYEIALPELKVQRSIVNIFELYEKRRDINKDLKKVLKEITPLLIKGATQESKGVIWCIINSQNQALKK